MKDFHKGTDSRYGTPIKINKSFCESIIFLLRCSLKQNLCSLHCLRNGATFHQLPIAAFKLETKRTHSRASDQHLKIWPIGERSSRCENPSQGCADC